MGEGVDLQALAHSDYDEFLSDAFWADADLAQVIKDIWDSRRALIKFGLTPAV